ncbi:MAG: hypothetical protein AB1411_06190 [Nitrospirota bacterium]
MVHHQDRHPDQPAHQHIDEVNEHGEERARQQLRLDEAVRIPRQETLFAKTRKLLGDRERDSGVQAPDENLDRPALKDPELADEDQRGRHDRGQCDDHDRLDGEGEGVDQFLDRQGHDEREKADRQRVCRDDREDSSLDLQEQSELGQGVLQQSCRRRIVARFEGLHRFPASPF